MSLFQPVNLVCPGCGELIIMEAVGSVNADRRPDFRDDILNSEFQDVTCASCNESFRLQPSFNYLDVGRGQWIACLPIGRMPDYLAAEDEVTELFAVSYGEKAPRAARDVGDELSVRLVFGWPAVREKIFAREHELDDVVLELVKLDLLRRAPSAPMAPGVEMRLVNMTDDGFGFVWIDSATEKAVEEVTAPRSIYDHVEANVDGWRATHALLENGPFVDIQKLYMGQGRDAA